jgi:UDP-N-acetylmuramoylalanine--D-glutamate ligase
LLKAAGQDVVMAGNIGPNLLDTWRERAAGAGLPAVWVLELSSFQLDGVDDFEPTASTVLNLSEDHLDWHGSMDDYCAAKARIVGSTGLLVLNRNDARVMALQPVSDAAKKKKAIEREVASFGSDAPRVAGDWGLENVNGMNWLVRLIEREGGRKKARAGAPEHEGYDDDAPFMQRLMPAEALRISGQHNALNALAALALASHTQATLGPMLYALREYRGEPHRASTVAVVQDVEYINDSKGTNVGATVAALQGLGQDRRLVLIAGGEGKGQDFSPLAAVVTRHTRAVVLIGRDAPLLRQALQGCGVPLIEAASMLDAVRCGAEQAQAGDAVLLSPACASFDMFDHYVQRGEAFAQAVQALAEDAGVVWEGAA